MARQDKDKGKSRIAGREGLGRLRRAHRQDRRREGDLARHADEDTAADSRSRHSGAELFNRLHRARAQHGTTTAGVLGEICGFKGTSTTVRLDADQREVECHVRTVLKKRLRGFKTPLVIGDRVRVDQLESNDPVVVDLEERRNALVRADSHNKALAHVIAANVDYLVIVSSLVEPDCRPGLVDRYLIAAALDDIEPIIVFTKADLLPPEYRDDIPDRYRNLDYKVLVSGPTAEFNAEHEQLRQWLHGHSCVFAGQSGVGKSSLVNILAPDIAARVGDISEAAGKGQHTTTSARSYLLPHHTRLIDTPGIRELALMEIDPLTAALLYPDIARFHHNCKFNDCTHRHEPHCAVMAAVEAGEIHPMRYESYCRLCDGVDETG
jgi:ribosome biogenesis GTPase